VIIRRSHGAILQCMNPFHHHCPASVPVIVLLSRSPAARQRIMCSPRPFPATAPASGTLSRIQSVSPRNELSPRPAPSRWPFPKNTGRSQHRIAALSEKGDRQRHVESIVLTAAPDASTLRPSEPPALHQGRVQVHGCGGITVAPMIPRSPHKSSRMAEARGLQRAPISPKPGCVCGSTKISMK